MLHDGGYVVIYRVEGDETAPPPIQKRLVVKAEQCFGERTVGITRFYAAAKVGQRADRVIEIWRDDTISTWDVCCIDGRYYHIQQVAATTDEDGLQVTRLTLEETHGSVWEGDSHGN